MKIISHSIAIGNEKYVKRKKNSKSTVNEALGFVTILWSHILPFYMYTIMTYLAVSGATHEGFLPLN